MAGKGGKGLLAAKTMAAGKDKDKKKPVSRSSRAGLQEAECQDSFAFPFDSVIGYASEGVDIWKFYCNANLVEQSRGLFKHGGDTNS
ncbi:hypothetical protein MRB53_026139 [Persea americana]|uniref:Uncharacterized protein n=1 Tax=Persea americana TaxID=3435 RepID=A0ACC2LI58_PERAE|nr:hypothetical protein MRB53_026139 [Persea americana]